MDAEKKTADKLWAFFESQLKISVNFRIHRPNLMQFRQRQDESHDDFVTRARNMANKCQFTEEEPNERLIKLIIVSTPYDCFREELLGKGIGFSINEVLKKGRKFEAFTWAMIREGNWTLNL